MEPSALEFRDRLQTDADLAGGSRLVQMASLPPRLEAEADSTGPSDETDAEVVLDGVEDALRLPLFDVCLL